MFFSEVVLVKKGALARVWLAAHWEKKLSKTQFLQANIQSSVGAIVGDGQEPMALRLSGQLLLGVVRIYSRKARYLLEDCTEALVKIKMAFRPGIVNLPDDQAVANLNAITMADTLTEFDILLHEPAFTFDMPDTVPERPEQSISSQNVSRVSDITMRDSVSLAFSSDQGGIDLFGDIEQGLGGVEGLLNFDVEPEVPAGARRPSIAPSEIEVGREAVPELPFAPEEDAAEREKSVPKDPVPPVDEPSAGDLFSFNAPEEAELPSGVDTAEAVQRTDDLFGEDIAQPLLDISAVAELPRETRDLAVVVRSPATTPEVAKELVAKPATTRKRKIIVDNQTELPARQIMAQLKDTSDITIKPSILPSSTYLLSLMNARRNLALSRNYRPSAPRQVSSLFDLSDQALALPPRKVPRVDIQAEPLQEIPEVRISESPETKKKRKLEELEAQEESPKKKGTPAEGEEEVIPPTLEQGVLEELGGDVPIGFTADMGDLPLGPEMSFNAPSSSDDVAEAEVPELSLSMSTSSAKGKVRLFEDSDDAVDSSIGSDRGYSKATLSTIRLLQDTLKTEDAPPASFHTLTKDARRSDKVRLFFELLVLKTKDMIGVQQDEPFKDVLISGKASLFAAGAAS